MSGQRGQSLLNGTYDIEKLLNITRLISIKPSNLITTYFISGMCLIAEQNYTTNSKRSKVMGLVMGSIALGVLVGYPFGSILYDFSNKSTPFNIIIFAIALNLGKSYKKSVQFVLNQFAYYTV